MMRRASQARWLCLLAALGLLGCSTMPPWGTEFSPWVEQNGLRMRVRMWPISIGPGARAYVQYELQNVTTNDLVVACDPSFGPSGYSLVMKQDGTLPRGPYHRHGPGPVPFYYSPLPPGQRRRSTSQFAEMAGDSAGREGMFLDVREGPECVTSGTYRVAFCYRQEDWIVDPHGHRGFERINLSQCWDVPTWTGYCRIAECPIELRVPEP